MKYWLIISFILLLFFSAPSIYGDVAPSDESIDSPNSSSKAKNTPEEKTENTPEKELPLMEESPSEQGETFGVPLPIFSTDPNTGDSIGFLLAVVTESEGHISSIVVPLLTDNELTGINFDLNVLGFPSDDIDYFLLLSHSSEDFWDYQFEYEHHRFWAEDLTLEFNIGFENSASNRFHGIGANSEEDDETSFTFKEIIGAITIKKKIFPHFSASFGIKGRSREPGDSVVEDVPSLVDLFPDEEGIEGVSYTLPVEFGLSYDTRDSRVTPSSGILARMFLEVGDEAVLSSFSFRRYGGEVRGYIPLDDEGVFTTAIRGLIEFVDGDDIPFFELSSLGGKNSLRGFGKGRFYDNHRVLVNIEERIRLYRWLVGDINLDIETAVFLDMGQVFRSPRDIKVNDIQFVLGAGVRFVVRSQIVAAIDFGYGEEGSAAFAGLDYPF